MTTQLTFVRHAESVLNTRPEQIVGRSNHAPLTVRGLYQASLLGGYLRESGQRFDAVYSSGAVRTDRTAQAIIDAAGYDLRVVVDERLQEVSQGPWEGRLREDVYTDDFITRYRLDSIDGCLPGAESILHAQARGLSALDDMDQRPESRILIVSHGLLIRSIAGHILRQNKHEILNTSTPNVSLTRLSVNGTDRTVEFVGKTVISE